MGWCVTQCCDFKMRAPVSLLFVDFASVHAIGEAKEMNRRCGVERTLARKSTAGENEQLPVHSHTPLSIHIMHTQARHSFVVMYLRVVIKFVTRHSRAQRGLTRRPATTLCRIPQVGRVRDTHDTLSA
jgi:hypothetical protein